MNSLAAQGGGSCPIIYIDGVELQPTTGPGEAFGVTAYQCASCSFKRDKGKLAEYSFSAEPIVLEIASWSSLRVGDVIEAVNGRPITTLAGADQLTYPRAGESLLSVRRSGSRIELRATARPECPDLSTFDPNGIDRIEVLKGVAAENLYGARGAGGVVQIFRKPRYERLSVIGQEPAGGTDSANTSRTAGRYGFAISCLPSCSRAKASDGTGYWKFDGYPPIAGIRAGGPAAMMGLRVGDIVTEIDGISILTEAGALRFQRSERKESLHVTVMRDGKKFGYLLQAR
ncbi:MAG: PDZ domain-containing protein [Gemmatimonadaceae bacterium]